MDYHAGKPISAGSPLSTGTPYTNRAINAGLTPANSAPDPVTGDPSGLLRVRVDSSN